MSLAPEQYKPLVEKVVSGLGLRLSERQIEQLATHFALLVHWNRKINLTGLRRPEDIAVRHFEESLFLVKLLAQVGTGLEACPACPERSRRKRGRRTGTDSPAPELAGLLVDVGSGAGFPGLPIKIACPAVTAVLLEPTTKKVAFLKEVIRSCELRGIEARAERLEQAARGELAGRASLVTLRAVALTPELLADLKKLLAPDGRLALFLGEKDALALVASPEMQWESPVPIPHSERRVILMGRIRNE